MDLSNARDVAVKKKERLLSENPEQLEFQLEIEEVISKTKETDRLKVLAIWLQAKLEKISHLLSERKRLADQVNHHINRSSLKK